MQQLAEGTLLQPSAPRSEANAQVCMLAQAEAVEQAVALVNALLSHTVTLTTRRQGLFSMDSVLSMQPATLLLNRSHTIGGGQLAWTPS